MIYSRLIKMTILNRNRIQNYIYLYDELLPCEGVALSEYGFLRLLTGDTEFPAGKLDFKGAYCTLCFLL